jgi:hypothetical protein
MMQLPSEMTMYTLSTKKQKYQFITLVGLYLSTFLVVWYGLTNYFWDSELDSFLVLGLAIFSFTFLYHIYSFLSGLRVKTYSNWWKAQTAILVLIVIYLINIIIRML